MRLTCPNCGAQYEVPDDIIPTGGRDVQCSNCGNTWFQVHADMQAEEPVENAVADVVAAASEEATQDDAAAPEEEVFEEVEPPELSIEAEPEDNQDFFDDEEEENPDDLDLGGEDWDLETEEDWAEESAPQHEEAPADAEEHREDIAETPDAQEEESEPVPAPEPDDEDELEVAADLEDDLETDALSEDDGAVDAEPEPAPKPRGLDDSVKDILREEVEYESRARAAEQPQSLETQGDLGLDQGEDRPTATDRRADEAANRLRRLRGQDDAATAAAVAATVRSAKDTRRDLLPDIEEINSTLRTSGDTPRNPDLGQKTNNSASRARGFRLGFALVILLAGAAVFVYSSHDSLSKSYPQAAPYIDSFMASANGARIWLDDKVAGLFLKLNALTGQS
ncbi:MAG: zinc-ribbon domain-containing protein [Shimia sp.]|uniref:zinc-ribbon domain-containing protein n=1 Tax=Shimia sp. TaxID=1954381 RepID=UPI0025E1C091|nr:zinc-ribbon domain-containing protein [Shimia sp.]MCH2067648.1 zinc-ribbon domain-containing protein [Shimia sp.]